VNNAATTARSTLEDATIEQWEITMAVNVRAPFLLMQEAVRSMKTRGGGSIVNIGSINAYVGLPQLGPYSVSKGALMTMTKNAALALGRYHIRVNQLNVGWTLTEGEEAVQRSDGKGPDWYQEACATRPFGRLLLPADIAMAAAYFASADTVVSGAVIDVEQFPLGGLSPW
jgi:NAD(P)-dependent dehydrogenase (short-subunit alcohol dehydrogenase family)